MKDQKDKSELEKKLDLNETPVKKPLLLEGHKPTTRREFISQGFMAGSAIAFMPSIFDLISSSAHAAVKCTSATASTGQTPVIIIDLAGGGNIAGSNVMVGLRGGQMDYLSSYRSLGLPDGMFPQTMGVNTEMGLAFHPTSGILRGIQQTANATIRGKVEGAIFCTISDDDTGNNQLNPAYWLNKAGAKGRLTQLAGTRSSVSGGRSQPPTSSINPSVAPVVLRNAQEAQNLVSLGTTIDSLPKSKVEGILSTMSRMSDRKLASISKKSLPQQIKDVVGCGFSATSDQYANNSKAALDPTMDAAVTASMGGIADTNDRNAVSAIAKLALDGVIGVGTVEIDGYDYHTGTRAEGERKDRQLGTIIGSIFSLAAAKGKDIIVLVYTDGGVSANGNVDNTTDGAGKLGWAGDSGNRSSQMMMVYRHAGKPSIRGNRQIGAFKNDGNVDATAALTSNSVVNTAKAVVANYLALQGKEGTFENVVGDNPFINQGLDKYLVFNKLK